MTKIVFFIYMCVMLSRIRQISGDVVVGSVTLFHSNIYNNSSLAECFIYQFDKFDIKVTWMFYADKSALKRLPMDPFTWSRYYRYLQDVGRTPYSYFNELYWNETYPHELRKKLKGYLQCMVEDEESADNFLLYPDFRSEWRPEKAILDTQSLSGVVLRDEPFNITCVSTDTGNPRGEVVWRTPIEDRNFTTEVINIESAKEEHIGIWQCWFTNEYGNGHAAQVTISVIWSPGPSILSITNSANVTSGVKTVTLTCTCIEKGNPIGRPRIESPNGQEYSDDVVSLSHVTTGDIGVWKCFYRNAYGDGVQSQALLFAGVKDVYRNDTRSSVGRSSIGLSDGMNISTGDVSASSNENRSTLLTILVAVFVPLFIIAVFVLVILVTCYLCRTKILQSKDSSENKEQNATYVNIPLETLSQKIDVKQGGSANVAMSITYEDVDIGVSSNTGESERNSYMDLDQVDVHRNGIKNPDLATYAALSR